MFKSLLVFITAALFLASFHHAPESAANEYIEQYKDLAVVEMYRPVLHSHKDCTNQITVSANSLSKPTTILESNVNPGGQAKHTSIKMMILMPTANSWSPASELTEIR